MKAKQRMRGDNLVLSILIVISIILALLVGAGQGFELGIKKCNKHYSEFIDDKCYCFINVNPYQTERVIPLSMLNLSLNIS